MMNQAANTAALGGVTIMHDCPMYALDVSGRRRPEGSVVYGRRSCIRVVPGGSFPQVTASTLLLHGPRVDAAAPPVLGCA